MPETPVAKHESGPGMVKTVNQAKSAKKCTFPHPEKRFLPRRGVDKFLTGILDGSTVLLPA